MGNKRTNTTVNNVKLKYKINKYIRIKEGQSDVLGTILGTISHDVGVSHRPCHEKVTNSSYN